MAGSFRIAEGYVEITADETSYNRSMQRLQSRRYGVNVGVNLDDSAALGRLGQLMRDQTVRLFADLDTRSAAADLALLTRPRTSRITADADTRSAADDLALLTRNRTMNVRVDVDRSALGFLTGLGGGGGGMSALSASIARIVAMIGSALPTVASLGQSLLAVGPAAALAVPAVLSLGSAFAAIKIGTSGIGDAFKQAFAPASAGAKAAASSARQVEAAERSLARAQQGVKDAEVRAAEARVQAARQIRDAQLNLKNTVSDVAESNRQAAEKVAQAERDVTDAQKAARQAQEDLTQARKDAARQLEDLANQQADAELNHREAVLRVQDAQTELNKVLADPTATQQQRDEAQLTYDEAVQHLKEQELAQKRLAQDAKAANKAGVNGSDQVKAAQDRLAGAQQSVIDKTQALADAQIAAHRTEVDGTQKVAKAERDLADARAASAKAAVDGARQIADAQAQVADSARAVADAQAAGAAATGKTAAALAKLAPNARDFVNRVVALAPAWRALKLDVQNTLFAGLGKSITDMAHAALPSLRDGLVGTAGILNTTAKNAADAVTNLGKAGLLRRLFDGLNDSMRPLTRIPGQFLTGLTQIGIAASPGLERLNTAVAGAADRISGKLTDAFKSGRMEDAINHGITIAMKFGRMIADAFGALKNVMSAAASAGGDALTTLGGAFKELKRITALPEIQGSLKSVFRALSSIASTLTDVVGAALVAIVPMIAPIADAFAGIADAVKGPLTGFFHFIGDHQTMFGALATGILAVVSAMKLWELATIVMTGVQAALDVALDANPIGLVVLGLAGLAAGVTYAWKKSETFRSVVTGVWESIKTVFAATWDFIDTFVVQPFKKLYDVLVGHSIIPDLVHAIGGWFTTLWTNVKKIFTAIVKAMVDPWISAWSTLKKTFGAAWDWLRNAFGNAWSWVKNSFAGLRSSVTNTWSAMWGGIRDKASSIFSGIRGKLSDFKNGVVTAFKSMRDSLGTIWKGIQDKLSTPVKWVVGHVYNQGIRTMWNAIASKVSSKIQLPAIKLGFAHGGVIPGTGNRDDVPIWATPGERMLSRKQVAKMGGHAAIDATVGRSDNDGAHYAGGGIIGSIKGALGGAWDWTKNVALGGLKEAAQKAISAIVGPLIARIPGGGFGDLLKGLSNRALDGILGFLGGQDKKATASGQISYKAGAGVAQWAPQIGQALSLLGQSAGWLGTVERRMNQESGGNPNIVNKWDSNWTAGHPSVGLMQVIGPTFQAHAGRFRNTGPFSYGTSVDPLANIYAGLDYALGRYGSLSALNRPGGYDNGGILAPGATLAVNRTGKPEAVLNPEDRAKFEALIRNGGGANVTVNMTVNSLTTPSPAERRRFANDMAKDINEALRQWNRGRA